MSANERMECLMFGLLFINISSFLITFNYINAHIRITAFVIAADATFYRALSFFH